MARYRSKDETDLRWNSIRRRITRELDLQIAEWREQQLDKLLTHAWVTYAKSLESGEVIELKAEYSEWVGRALEEHVTIQPVEGDDDAPLAA